MPEIDLVDSKNQKVGSVDVSPDIFDAKVKDHLVQMCVNQQLANRRSGTASTKSSYSELRGGGKKPWRQKGTGRARAGSNRSAIWRGGLTTFGPTPRSFGFKVSKKIRKQALISVLTDRMRENKMRVVDKIELSEPKTKEALAFLEGMGLSSKVIFVLEDKNQNLELAVRNLPNVDVLRAEGLNVYDLLVHENIVFTQDSIKKVQERLA